MSNEKSHVSRRYKKHSGRAILIFTTETGFAKVRPAIGFA
jgi:hypothetical protein